MLEKMRNLRVIHKLSLAVILMGIPALIFAVLFVQERNRDIQTMRDELASVEHLSVIRKTFDDLILHRGYAFRVLSGEASYRAPLLAIEPQVEADLAQLDQSEGRFGLVLGTGDLVKDLHTRWQELKTRNYTSAKENLDAHTELLSRFMTLMRTVGDYRMAVDPDLASNHMGRVLVRDIPALTNKLGLLRGEAVNMISKGTTTEADRRELVALITDIERITNPQTGELRASMTAAFKANPILEQQIGPLMSSTLSQAGLIVQTVTDNLLNGKGTLDAREFFASASEVVTGALNLYNKADQAFRADITTRIEAANRAKYINIAAVGIGLLVASLMVWLVARGITRQVGAMTNLFSMIGIGDFSARAQVYSRDEIGQAALSLNAMLDNTLSLIQSREEKEQIQQSIQTLLEEISGLAEGDLTQEAQVTAEITGALADAFNNMSSELRNVISRVQDTTLAVSSSASEVQTTTEHLASGSESQASQIVEASAAIDEMAVSIQQVSANAASAAAVAESALQNAKLGSDAVSKTINGMNGIRQQVQQTAKRIKRLGESSQEIGEIVQMINDIAERTSILALNASIQAAMAGEAGKGFAVVAEEVERLADHSTEATKKISTLIKSIQADTNEAITAMEETTREVVAESGLANEAGLKLADIETVSTRLSDLIQSISQASKQQSRGSEGVAKSMSEISQVTQQTAAGAKQAAVSIRRLAELADDLRGSLNRFKLPTTA